MRKLQRLIPILFALGGAVIMIGLFLEAFQLINSAWPPVFAGFGLIAASVYLDGYKWTPS